MYSPIFIKRKRTFAYQDFIALLLLIAILSIFSFEFEEVNTLIEPSNTCIISLDWENLLKSSLRTALRMLIAIFCSLIFAIIYAKIAVQSIRFEKVLVALLDILQSIPIFGYLAFTVTWFMSLFPGKIIGMELAVIFAIFTSQVWNMTFSFYQSLKSLPKDLQEVSDMIRLSAIEKFFKLELPHALPGLIWNSMISMSGGWFFIVASEAIKIGNTEFDLPGIGSYIALAIETKNLHALSYAILGMFSIILVYDQLLFKPLVVWSNKFKYESCLSNNISKSWFYNIVIKSEFFQKLSLFFANIYNKIVKIDYKFPKKKLHFSLEKPKKSMLFSYFFYIFLMFLTIYNGHKLINFFVNYVKFEETLHLLKLTSYTIIRIIVLMILSSIIWTPIGVFIGFRAKLSARIQTIIQFLAALPVNLYFPIIVPLIVKYQLNPNIWLSILMILGSQWYILFNVIAAVLNFPNDLKEVITNFQFRKIDRYLKIILPSILPYLVTGAITAAGGAWNASIIAEVANWGNHNLKAEGIGSYIAEATQNGDFVRIILGISFLTLFIIFFNKILWRPLYKMTEKYTQG